MLTGNAKVAGVMGWPVAHSLSPALHGWWLKEYGVDGAYVPFAVAPENLENALRALPKLGLRGVNLTLPHKEAAARIVDRRDAAAEASGAVNTVVVEADGSLTGMNTDAYGFAENLREGLGRFPTGPALVLGAGGAAQAVVTALLQEGADTIFIANRSREKAEKIAARDTRIVAVAWEKREEAMEEIALLVNATSLGMRGQPALELRLDALPKKATVTDIVYAPLETELLAAARARGNAAIDGLGMLLHQARPGFAAWFGVTPDVTPALRQHVLSAGAAA